MSKPRARRKSSTLPPHPMQPIVLDEYGKLRFRQNAIVRMLLHWASDRGMSLNDIASQGFSDEEQMHFAQLIGYSVTGYGELPYVSDKSYAVAEIAAGKRLCDEMSGAGGRKSR